MRIQYLASSLALVSGVFAAQLTQVSNYGGSARAKPGMYVKPIHLLYLVNTTRKKYFQNSLIPWKKGSDTKGKASLSHNGGGDSNAIANMITYAIDKYKIDPKKVFVTGGSSGGMMSNVLAATYPELISAVSLYSGVPAGCFVSASGAAAAWNNTCSGGQSISTAQHWGDVVRGMYPGYNGTRPRMQFWHGSVDGTLSPKNYDETLKQWTNVFGVSTTPTSSKKDTPERNYRTDDFGPSVEGIWAVGVGHSVPSHLTVSEAWFGL
ncbi:unnamed protein product [Alternaria alternata]